jgi:hypothetical protein
MISKLRPNCVTCMHLLTAWNSKYLEKLNVAELVESEFHYLFHKSLHWDPKLIHMDPAHIFHSEFLTIHLMVTFHLRLGLPSNLPSFSFLLGFQTKFSTACINRKYIFIVMTYANIYGA